MADQSTFGIAGLLGWPVAHSRSPVIHNHWLAHHGIPGRYVLFPVPAEKLEAAVRGIAVSGVRILVDHCGRPTLAAGLGESGFQALLDLGRTGRAFVKLSGFVKFSRRPAPYEDAWPFVAALVDAFTLERCLWASDWPYLRAPVRVDYGVLLQLALELFPDVAVRRKLMWDTPRELFGFAA